MGPLVSKDSGFELTAFSDVISAGEYVSFSASVLKLRINPMIQPEPEDLPKDNPFIRKMEALRPLKNEKVNVWIMGSNERREGLLSTYGRNGGLALIGLGVTQLSFDISYCVCGYGFCNIWRVGGSGGWVFFVYLLVLSGCWDVL
ncbi:hypothetical protein Tco_1369772 [Tanacetum coccineum]